MTNRERAITALEGRIPDYVPTFELEFQLTEELFGKSYYTGGTWRNKTPEEIRSMVRHNAELYLAVAETLEYSIIMEVAAPTLELRLETIKTMREIVRDEYMIIAHGDATWAIPDGDNMMEFSYYFHDHADEAKAKAAQMVKNALEQGKRLVDGGLDGFALCADYCFNQGPFFSPAMFREFVFPYLAELIEGYRDMGAYAIKHTDGNIMPILDQLIEANPHALHSLDPMAGIDIKEVKAQYGDKVCLIGNVNCADMQTGTDDEVRASAEYALKHGKPGGGYIFSTSNVAFKGLELERYLMILDIWKRERYY